MRKFGQEKDSNVSGKIIDLSKTSEEEVKEDSKEVEVESKDEDE